MSYEAAEKSIYGRLQTQWSDATPIKFQNRRFDAPEPYASDGVTPQPYLEARVTNQSAFRRTVSASQRETRHPGLLTIEVRVPAGEGHTAANALADTAVGIFDNVTFSGITFRTPTARPRGVEGGWYRVEVSCPFYRDAIN